MEKHRNSPKKRWVLELALGMGCILLNLAGRWLAVQFALPIWLDSVGVYLAAVFTNWAVTAAAAVGPVLLVSIWHPQALWYALAALGLALVLRFCARKGWLRFFAFAETTGFLAGLLLVILYTPLDMALNHGLTGNLWGDAFYDMLQFRGAPQGVCILGAEALVHIISQQFCAFAACLVLRLTQWKQHKKIGTQMLALGLAVVLGAACLTMAAPAVSAQPPEVGLDAYNKTIYDEADGLPSSGVNALAQTSDGMIWFGSYAGLCRYDGTRIEYLAEGGIASVTSLLADRQGRLWIGTNDQGLAVYEADQVRWMGPEQGLSERFISGLFEAHTGEIYVGTQGGLYVLGQNEVLRQVPGAAGVRSMAQNNQGQIVCVDLNGSCLLLEGDRVLQRWWPPEPDLRYTCVVEDGSDFWVGTSGSHIQQLRRMGRELHWGAPVPMGTLQNVSQLRWDSQGQLWACTYRGVGHLSAEGLIELQYPGFSNAVRDMIEDYEGNYWFASSHNGVMKLSLSPFADLYSYLSLEKKVINAVTMHQEMLWVGTDVGLDVIDQNEQLVQNELTRRVQGHRVRCVQEDSQGRLWVCAHGVLLCEQDGHIREYGLADGTAGDEFRCLQELPDGTMAVGSSQGITLIRGDEVAGRLDQSSGLRERMILGMAAAPDGTLYAGSDGSGIYVIREGRVVDTITEEDGLTSGVVMRMVPYENGFFVVTSNALNWLENGRVRRLEKFPYFDNYDVVLNQDEALVLSSRGIFVTTPQDLVAQNGRVLPLKLYGRANGMQGAIVANSWPYLDAQGNLYFCSNVGVERLDRVRTAGYSGPYKIQISAVEADGERILPQQGVYHLGAGVEQIRLKAAVCNYTLEDLPLRFYVEGLEQQPDELRQSQLAPIVYKNIPSGEYQICLQVLDDRGDVAQQQTIPLIKDARMWENTYYQLYLMAVFTWLVIFATWIGITMAQLVRRRHRLEEMRQELEEKVAEQTRRISAMQWNVVESMASLIEGRDGSTGEHVRNAGAYVRMIAEEMLRRGMYPEIIDRRYVDEVSQLAPLHDVGKIRIPDAVLNKPGRLTDEEYEIMKTHAALGGQVIQAILGEEADPALVELAQQLTTCHHERWDGKGYPAGKKGTQIPLCARIMAVADVFDALSSRRVYKQAMDLDDVFNELKKGEGTQFQPEIVEVFLSLKPQVQQYLKEHGKTI